MQKVIAEILESLNEPEGSMSSSLLIFLLPLLENPLLKSEFNSLRAITSSCIVVGLDANSNCANVEQAFSIYKLISIG